MFSKIIIVLFAINVIPAVNGFIDSKLRVLDPILKCFKTNAPEYSGEKALAAGRNLDSDADFIKWTCLAFGEGATCMTDVLEKTPSPVPKVFLFYGAVAYQITYLLKKANICPGIKYDDLKRIVLNSGVLEKEGLSNIENDPYHKCAGDIIKKCFIAGAQMFEQEQGDPDANDDVNDAEIRCIEAQTKTCNYRIMRHFFEAIEAYRKQAKQLEMLESEERQG